jgi:O-antigen/teichoic acid export membrane protein
VAPIIVLHERSRAFGVINVVAAVVNVVGDVVLVGVVGVGVIGPAIATVVSFGVIAVGYFYVAADCVELRPTLPFATIVPAAVGVAGALALHGPVAPVLGLAAVVASSLIVLGWARPFTAGDVDMIEKLDIPAPLKKVVVNVLTRFA